MRTMQGCDDFTEMLVILQPFGVQSWYKHMHKVQQQILDLNLYPNPFHSP